MRTSGDESRDGHSDARFRPGSESIDLLSAESMFTKRDQERERARRVLIYRDMIAKTGKIKYRLLAGWMCQPTVSEVDALLAEMTTDRRKANAPKVKQVA